MSEKAIHIIKEVETLNIFHYTLFQVFFVEWFTQKQLSVEPFSQISTKILSPFLFRNSFYYLLSIRFFLYSKHRLRFGCSFNWLKPVLISSPTSNVFHADFGTWLNERNKFKTWQRWVAKTCSARCHKEFWFHFYCFFAVFITVWVPSTVNFEHFWRKDWSENSSFHCFPDPYTFHCYFSIFLIFHLWSNWHGMFFTKCSFFEKKVFFLFLWKSSI